MGFKGKEGNIVFNPFKVNGKKNVLALIISVILAEGTGALSGYLGMSNSQTYESLIKPFFAPPPWVFGVVWPILYLLMGIAAYRIWMRGRGEVNNSKSITLYIIQLLLNFLWTIIFFRWRLIGLAFFELMLLLIFILLTTFDFLKLDKLAGLLMIPYILWVSFAGVLNFTFWMLNNM
jgi:translocator protein